MASIGKYTLKWSEDLPEAWPFEAGWVWTRDGEPLLMGSVIGALQDPAERLKVLSMTHGKIQRELEGTEAEGVGLLVLEAFDITKGLMGLDGVSLPDEED